MQSIFSCFSAALNFCFFSFSKGAPWAREKKENIFFYSYFFACPPKESFGQKSKQKKTPENDNSPFSGWFPD